MTGRALPEIHAKLCITMHLSVSIRLHPWQQFFPFSRFFHFSFFCFPLELKRITRFTNPQLFHCRYRPLAVTSRSHFDDVRVTAYGHPLNRRKLRVGHVTQGERKFVLRKRSDFYSIPLCIANVLIVRITLCEYWKIVFSFCPTILMTFIYDNDV